MTDVLDRLVSAALDPTLTARTRREAAEKWLTLTHPPRAPHLAEHRARHEAQVVDVVISFFSLEPGKRDEPIPEKMKGWRANPA